MCAGPQERLGRGEYNPATTRVLHYVHNPEAAALREADAAKISQLQAEAAALRSQLAALQPQQQEQAPPGGGTGSELAGQHGAAAESGGGAAATAAAVAAAERTLLEHKVPQTFRHAVLPLAAAQSWGVVREAADFKRSLSFVGADWDAQGCEVGAASTEKIW